MAVKWLALRGPFTAGSWQALNGRQMATLKRAICDKKWLAMLPFLPFVALTETTNGPFMSCLLGTVIAAPDPSSTLNKHAEIVSTCRHRAKFRYDRVSGAPTWWVPRLGPIWGLWAYIAAFVVNYGISNTIVLEMPWFTARAGIYP